MLPNGDRLTPERFLQLGIPFGYAGSMETVHYLVEIAFAPLRGKRQLSYEFLRGVYQALHFDTNPIYAVLHEQIYCEETASDWAAHRVQRESPEFELNGKGPVLFTGEMVYPWMVEQYRALRPFAEAAEMRAKRSDWPRLYQPDVLRANRVPTVAAVYYDDMYVDFDLSQAAAASIDSLQVWVTNQFEHNAVRIAGKEVLDHLIGLLRGSREYYAGSFTGG